MGGVPVTVANAIDLSRVLAFGEWPVRRKAAVPSRPLKLKRTVLPPGCLRIIIVESVTTYVQATLNKVIDGK